MYYGKKWGVAGRKKVESPAERVAANIIGRAGGDFPLLRPF